MYADNGILAVPGQYVAEGSLGLPDAATASDQELVATVDADWAGVVVITYVRTIARHRKHRHWYWRAVRADASPVATVPADATSLPCPATRTTPSPP